MEVIEIKKKSLSVILFVIAFVGAYMIMCYCIPGLRIKLAADPMRYFIESIKFAAVFKIVISCVVGAIVAMIPYMFKRK